VRIVQGARDPLVLLSDFLAWQRHGFSGSVASLILPYTQRSCRKNIGWIIIHLLFIS
jgi:hypothetical protein